MRIALLHTADVHVATFDAIFGDLGADAAFDHCVDADLLERARRNGIESVRSDVTAAIEGLADADAVLCTCSTLGPLVDDIAASIPNVVRIDRPLMEQACADGPNVLVALCLESTRRSTLDLLHECAAAAAVTVSPTVVMCADAWEHFERGDTDAFAESIAATITARVAAEEPTVGCIVLAQASMRVAADRLAGSGIPVLSSPVAAAQRVLEVGRQTGM